MDIIQIIPTIYGKFILFVLIFTRISSMLTTFVLFRRDLLTARVIIALSSLLSIFVLLNFPQPDIKFELFSVAILSRLFIQAIIGLISGLFLNLIFEVFIVAGQVVSTQAGLSIASLIDQRFGFITSLTHFYIITMTLIFLSLNGHLFILKALVDSFAVMPVDHVFVPSSMMAQLLSYSSILFSGAVMLAITIIIVLLMTNIALAVMTKFAPQFNLFSIGINLELLIGLFCVYATYQYFVNESSSLIRDSLLLFNHSIMMVK